MTAQADLEKRLDLDKDEYLSHTVYPDTKGVYEMDAPYAVVVNNDGSNRRIVKLTEQEVGDLRAENLLGTYVAPGGGEEGDEISS